MQFWQGTTEFTFAMLCLNVMWDGNVNQTWKGKKSEHRTSASLTIWSEKNGDKLWKKIIFFQNGQSLALLLPHFSGLIYCNS